MKLHHEDQDWMNKLADLDAIEAPRTYARRAAGPESQRLASSHHHSNRAVKAILGLAIVVSVSATTTLLVKDEHPATLGLGASSPERNGVAIAAGPCGGLASASNLADVTGASTPYTVYLPHDELADATSMTVWKCPGTELEFQFPSGINIYLDQNGLSDPGATWKAMAAQDPTDTSVGAVQGQPAAFIDPAKSKGGANGSISFVVGGTWIVVEGNGSIPLSDLIRVTNSMTATG